MNIESNLRRMSSRATELKKKKTKIKQKKNKDMVTKSVLLPGSLIQWTYAVTRGVGVTHELALFGPRVR